MSHWDAWVCDVCRLGRDAWDLQQNGLQRRIRISYEDPQNEMSDTPRLTYTLNVTVKGR